MYAIHYRYHPNKNNFRIYRIRISWKWLNVMTHRNIKIQNFTKYIICLQLRLNNEPVRNKSYRNHSWQEDYRLKSLLSDAMFRRLICMQKEHTRQFQILSIINSLCVFFFNKYNNATRSWNSFTNQKMFKSFQMLQDNSSMKWSPRFYDESTFFHFVFV